MSLTASLAAGGAGFATAAALTGLVRALLRRHGVLDRPNQRSSHRTAVPRGGGIAVVGVLLATWFGLWLTNVSAGGGALFWVALAGALGLAAVSWLDDLRDGVSIFLRLAVQVVAVGAGIASLPGDGLVFQGMVPAFVDHALAAAAWLWFVNLFNFMDGIDGLSGTEGASLGLGTFLLALLGAAPAWLGPLGLALAGVSLGFLLWNWHPCADIPRRCRERPAWLPGRLAPTGAGGGGRMAGGAAAARLLSRGCDAHSGASRAARPARVAGAPRALLSARGGCRLGSRSHDRTDRRP